MVRPAIPLVRRIAATGAAAAIASTLLAGCSAPAVPSASSPAATPTRTSTADPTAPSPDTAPALDPIGSASDNLAVFATVTETVWNSPDRSSGRAYVDALVAAGFDKAAMQVTNDTTTLGEPAESIQYSVLWSDGQCLVGQVGPATGTPVAAVLPAVGDGMCLLGQTRPIDW